MNQIMLDNIFENPTYIILMAVGAALLIGLFFLFYFTIFAHIRLKKQAGLVCGIFEKKHGLLFGQDSQYIKRLETISSMNLVYVQQFMDWSKRFKDIRDVSDASAQAAVNSLKDLLSERRFKELKALLPSARKTVEEFGVQVDDLDTNLRNKFLEEDESRNLSLHEKENFRKVKADYYAKQNDLRLIISTFDVLFHKIDGLFTEAEADIDNARYADAKVILNSQIDPVVSQIGKVLQDLPNICLEITSVIPDKLSSLSNKYDEMTQAGFPLNHILVKADFTSMNDELASLTGKVQALTLSGVAEELTSMQQRIDECSAAFDKEKEAREVFEKECDSIYSQENDLENNFINLCHALPKVRQIYLMGADDQAKIDGIQNTINKAGASKRSLDTYVHSATKQPYSILVEKMHTLRDQATEAGTAIDEFQKYLQSFKVDSEAASQALGDYFVKIKEAEKAVRDIGVDAVTKKYQPILDSLFSTLDSLYGDLRNLPIDVKKVNADLSSIKTIGDEVLANIAKDKENEAAAEGEIVFANRHRNGSAQVNSALLQSESLFFAGNFADSFKLASSSVKDIREDE
jgi:septation ring formation regulator EzrA